jgi:hypothetical protein
MSLAPVSFLRFTTTPPWLFQGILARFPAFLPDRVRIPRKNAVSGPIASTQTIRNQHIAS